MKILVFVGGTDGCTLHRILLPYQKIKDLNPENLTIDFLKPTPNQPFEELIAATEGYDVFVYHRLLPDAMFEALKQKNLILINDQDDNWELNSTHPLYSTFRKQLSEKIKYQIRNCDYITCTTKLIANKIKALNPNVAIFPNALEGVGQFKSVDSPNQYGRQVNSKPYIRIGWVGGSSHVADIRMLEGVVNQLPQDVKDKVQFVLCGFDGGKRNTVYPDGHVETTDLPYSETCWAEFERIFTDNYRNVSPAYKQWLLQFLPKINVETDEHYRRIWTKPIDSYATHFDQMDVVLIPLRKDFFNEVKSELKLVESSIKHKAVIISDVEPYTRLLKPLFDKGGTINPEGNVIAIGDNKGSSAWAKAITKLVRNPELISTLSDNLSKLTAEGAEFDLNKVAKDRIEWLRGVNK